MIQKINGNDFVNAFNEYGRADNFSIDGRLALYTYLTDIEADANEEIELDVIALCCEYSEYDSALEAAQAYGYEEGVDLEPHGSLDLLEVDALEQAQAKEWLEDRTSVIAVQDTGRVIVLQF